MAKAATKAPAQLSIYETLLATIQTSVPKFKGYTPGKENEQVFYQRVCDAINDLDEEAWDELDKPAQEWFNKAVKALNDEKLAKPMPGLPSAEDDDDEAPAPAKAKGKTAKAAAPPPEDDEDEEDEDEEDEDEEEEPVVAAKPKGKVVVASKVKAKAKAAPPPDEDDDDEDEEEVAPVKATKGKAAPAKATKAAKAPVADDDEDEDDDADEAPKPKFGGKRAPPFEKKPNGVTNTIRGLVVKHPEWEVEQIRKALDKKGHENTKTTTITTIRTDTLSVISAAKAAGRWQE